MFQPYARLLVFLSSGETDVSYLASHLGVSDGTPARAWSLSTHGVQAKTALGHVEALLGFIRHNSGVLKSIANEGYWIAVFFHDTRPPSSQEVAEITATLEEFGISFDFELERE